MPDSPSINDHRSNWSTSTSMILGIKTGDGGQWKRFVDFYTPLVHYWCRQSDKLLQESDIQDITQDVFVKVHKAIDKFDIFQEGRKFRAWFYTITKNTILDHVKQEIKRHEIVKLADDSSQIVNAEAKDEDTDDSADDSLDQGARLILIRQVRTMLHHEFKEQDWEIFNLFIIAGKTSSEVAEIMNMKSDTVRKIKYRVIKRLREVCASFGVEFDLPSF